MLLIEERTSAEAYTSLLTAYAYMADIYLSRRSASLLMNSMKYSESLARSCYTLNYIALNLTSIERILDNTFYGEFM